MKKLFIITGEASGDRHAAEVVKKIREADADIQIEAIGGKYLNDLGVKLFSDHSKGKMSAMGLDFKILFELILLFKTLPLDLIKSNNSLCFKVLTPSSFK